ncbi:YhjD/YihY/BrkB family envelope integrity protein [Streptacidiphilus neutrinimicus]|uniref:YhjD/YihY/BrkB family envelope integrity protein n=1 Tax=Streptacidiphilus neutrinimicus TaxID=105420 RepID=UPI0009FD9E9C|nr:YhjD/YihY/BrkB family envelope integrity protein [Streptacidiphilus neutrinimicus]
MADDSDVPQQPGDQPTDRKRTWLTRLRGGMLGRFLRATSELDLMRRSMIFAAQGLVTLLPLLLVVAAVDPFRQRGFSDWLVDGMDLSTRSATPLEQLFAGQHDVESATGALGLALLALFGIAFAAEVQTVYEKVWQLGPSTWRKVWRQATWLLVLTLYLAAEVESGVWLRNGYVEAVERVALLAASGLLFFWWGQRFLLAGRVSWRALLPGTLATLVGLGGLRVFSALVFDPMIVSNAESYGGVGIVLVVETWLIGVGFVFYAGALFGRQFHERRARVAVALSG